MTASALENKRILAVDDEPDVLDTLADTPRDVPLDDALDALAALWSAVRWRDGRARTLPDGAAERPFIVV